MQPLLRHKDAQMYFSPENNRSTSCRSQMKTTRRDAKKMRKIPIYTRVNHSITPCRQSGASPTYWAGVHTCSQTRSSAKVRWRCLPPAPDVAEPLLPLFLCLEIFLCPTFMSSSPALRSTGDKDERLDQKREEERTQIDHWKNDHSVHKWMEDGGSSVELLASVGPFKSLETHHLPVVPHSGTHI